MPDQFQLRIPTVGGEPMDLALNVGDVLYVLGANGSGKSSLITRLCTQNQAHARRIAAHRQTWFESNTLDITPRARQDLESNIQAHDANARSRYYEWNAGVRSNMAIFDLIDSDTMQARKIADLLRSGNDVAAKKEAQNPSPIEVINELMRLSNLPIEIGFEEGQKVTARKNGGNRYSVAELSDGERNAFLIAANVLTVKAGTLILIDEPERHLHRSIISPLLKLLFDKRKDCAFIVSTHEMQLPLDSPQASTMLIRSCRYEGANAQAWPLDIIPPGAAIDEDLKRDILGARRKMLFVEGSTQSLDAPLYALLFPQVSIIPKNGCRDVEYAVKGLRGAPNMHWVAAWGVVDNDQRSSNDIELLKEAGVWALSHYSVESLYFHPTIIIRLAERQAQMTGSDPAELVKSALDGAIVAANSQRDHLITNAVLRSARNKIQTSLPRRENITDTDSLKFEINVSDLRKQEEVRFDALVNAADWDGLLTRYPLRESPAFDRVVSGLKIVDRATYQAAVLKLLQDDPAALNDLRNLLGDLCANVTA